MNSLQKVNMNVDLQRERGNASFSIDELTCVLYKGRDKNERRKYIQNLAVCDPVLAAELVYHYLSREEKFSEGIRKAVHIVKKLKELELADDDDRSNFLSVPFPTNGFPFGLHGSMFIPTILNQGTKEQREKWLPLAKNYVILGTYAQTELGHGTYVRGLETTATYDPKTKEFIINSPTITSMKWWPGGVGKNCNYVVCIALLYVQGKNCGVQPFLVQIRDLNTHQPLPGVTVGDIGPKFGFETIDNGFLKFDNIRIPRENMLMKNAEVTVDGTFVDKSKGQKLSYGTMIYIRATLTSASAWWLAMAVTIATRYSCVRRQSELKPGAPEPQVLDYQTQQYKLFPLIATSFAFWFAGEDLYNTYVDINAAIQQGNTELLPELHALSAGLKAFSTRVAADGVEVCRLACGGHGYSQASGLPKIYVNATSAVTYEGESTVMLLQTARYLIKSFDRVKQGDKLTGSVAYLSDRSDRKSSIGADVSIESLLDAYKHRALLAVQNAANRLNKLEASGREKYEAWNLTSVGLVKASIAHCHYFVVKNFAERLLTMTASQSLRYVLTTLFKLYAAYGIVEHSGDFLLDGFLTRQQLEFVDQKLLDLLGDVRRNAVAIVDSFDFLDQHLQSVLGRFDGQVYENLYKWALESPLNKTQVHESYYKYLRPLLQRENAKL